jgi:trehalose/maltose hydrolase-like predicted phosphorylase/beta-phosphoglucomutase-like phosphatase (HAD superfamily)
MIQREHPRSEEYRTHAPAPASARNGRLEALDGVHGADGRNAGAEGEGRQPPITAVIFDLDEVTDTAALDAQAWKQMFDEVLPELAGHPVPGFDAVEDYRRYVDGRSREDAARAVLVARGLSVPEGEPGDAGQGRTVHGLAAREQELFVERLTRGGVRAFPSTITLLDRLRGEGVRTALVTASRDSTAVLAAAGALDLFDVRVDGGDAERAGLAGEPDPAMLLEGSRRLSVSPEQTAVVKSAATGVQAARRGGFGLVVGVDRAGNGSVLLAAGADLVVADLAGLDLARPVPSPSWVGGASAAAGPWTLTYDGFDPPQEGVRETLCTLANGYLGTRGAAAECGAGGVHYPGTYLAGVYNRLRSEVAGRAVEDEQQVNAPNWLPLSFRTADGDWITPDSATVVGFRQELDMHRGVLTRIMQVRDAAGRTTRVTSQRLVSQDNRHLAALRATFEAENWSGRLQVRSALDGRVGNLGVAEYRLLATRHLQPVRAEPVDDETLLLETATTQSRITLAMAARTRVFRRDRPLAPPRRVVGQPPDEVGHELDLELNVGEPVTVEKIIAVATSRDRAISTPALAVVAWAARAGDFAGLLAAHERAWARLWNDFAVAVHASQRARTALNLHAFHVLQTASAADADLDAGLPARGLHGEAYRGHVFWDEMFVYPMLTLRRPELIRALLLYRYRRLGEARAAARAAGLRGALFPWQSGSDGREETPTLLFNMRTGTWMPDHSRRQRHVGLAIAYSVIQYLEATGDVGFLATIGIELLVDIVRCFASMTTYDAAADRYDIDGVMGPDEFHDGYPGRPGCGVRNNAYTNILLAWTLRRTIAALDELDRHDWGRARRRLRIAASEPGQWERLSRRLRIPFHGDGVISQFDGYEHLAEFDWDDYLARDGDTGRLELTLAAAGDSTNNYRLAKQPDVLMLFYLLSAEDLRDTLERLGYQLDKSAVRHTVEFYLARTSHGSTLSRPISSWILARADRTRSWSLFNQALDSDLADIQGGTTREGIHLGAMAATVDLVLRCYSGLETRDGVLWVHPTLPPELARSEFRIAYRDHSIRVELTADAVGLQLEPGAAAPIQVWVDGQTATLHAGHAYRFDLTHAAAHR